MERKRFIDLSSRALDHLDNELGDLEHDALDVELAGDVLTLSFTDGTRFVINAHSAAGQIWMAADKQAWHFDYDEDRQKWICGRSGDELMTTVAGTVGGHLGVELTL